MKEIGMRNLHITLIILILCISTYPLISTGIKQEEFTYLLPDRFESLSPWDMRTHSDRQAISAIYSGLFIRTGDYTAYEFIPNLAEDYPLIYSNGIKIIVKLRDDLKFSSGENLTVEDVVFSFHSALSPAINKNSYDYYRQYFNSNDSIYAISETKIYFELSRPFVDYYDLLSLYIVSKNYYSPYFNQGIYRSSFFEDELEVTSGVYTLQSMEMELQYVDLVRNEYYWNVENTDTEFVYLHYMAKVDIISTSPFYNMLDPLYKFTLNETYDLEGRALDIRYLGTPIIMAYNFNHSYFGRGADTIESLRNLEVRKAISGILDSSYDVHHTPPYDIRRERDIFSSPDTYTYGIDPSHYNTELYKTISYMEAAGYNFEDLGEPDVDGYYNQFFFNVTVSVSPDLFVQDVADYYAWRLHRIGIGVSSIVNLNETEYNDLINTGKYEQTFYNGGYDLLFTSLEWDLNFNPYGLFNNGFNKNNYVNYFNYYNSSYEKIIDDYNGAYTQASKVEELRLVFDHLAKNVVVSPIFSYIVYGKFNHWGDTEKFEFTLFTYHSLEWTTISIGEIPTSEVPLIYNSWMLGIIIPIILRIQRIRYIKDRP